MGVSVKAGGAVRTRRSQEEARRALLSATRRRLEMHGYAGVSTRAVAADARTSPSLIFSHFGNKTGLIQAAVLEPFREFMDQLVVRQRDLPASASMLVEAEEWVSGMVRLFLEHRKLVLALIAAEALDMESDHNAGAPFARLMAPIEEVAVLWLGGWIWEGFDVQTAVRTNLGAIIAQTVLNNLLYEPGNQRTEQHIIEQLTRMFCHGLIGPNGLPQAIPNSPEK